MVGPVKLSVTDFAGLGLKCYPLKNLTIIYD